MVKITAYRCMNCGANIKFPKGENETTCEYCAYVNAKETVNANFAEIEKYMLEKYNELQQQIDSIHSGVQVDVESRDWIFNRDYKPRIETSFNNIEEKFEENFRKPLFNVSILADMDSKMSMEEIFNAKEWNSELIKPVINFWSLELNHPVMKNMAAKPASKNYLENIQARGNLLSNIYWIRGLSVDFTKENIIRIEKFCSKSTGIAKKMSQKYSKMNEEYQDEAFFYGYWEKRLALYSNLAKQLKNCLEGNYEEVNQEIKENIERIQQVIEEVTALKETQALYLLIPIIDGFTTDLTVFSFYHKVVEFIELLKPKSDFCGVLEFVTKYLKYTNNKFNNFREMPGWDNDWLLRIESPLDRIFASLENLVEIASIQKGRKKFLVLGDHEHRFSDGWQLNKLYSSNAMRDTYHVKSKINAFLPLAVVNSYSILTKGFLWLKAGEEFESYLFVNSAFNTDKSIEVGGYAKGLTFLDLGLKEKNSKKIKLEEVISSYERAEPIKRKIKEIIIPPTATNNEIQEFISKTYEMFAFATSKNVIPVKDFHKMYKNIGMGSNFERLTGEVLDRVYLPITFVEIAKAKTKKDSFEIKEEYQWKVVTQYPANEKEPLNNFLEMELRSNELLNLAVFSRELAKL
ncbi:MAG: hypothetical protein ACTSO7_16615 [Candidatus Heimdallarchaeota archaeon]